MRFILFFSVILLILLGFTNIRFHPMRGVTFFNLSYLVGYLIFAAYSLIKLPKVPLGSYLALILIFSLMNVFAVTLTTGLLVDNITYIHTFNKSVLAPIIFFCLAFIVLDEIDILRKMLVFILVVFAALQVIMIIEIFSGFTFFRVASHYVEGERAFGLSNPNKTGYLLSFLFPFYFYFYKDKNISKILRYIFFTALILTALFVIASGSRGAVLCLLFILFSFAFIMKQYKLLFILPASLLAFIPLFIFFPDIFTVYRLESGYERIFSTFGGEEEYGREITSGRIYMWTTACNLFLNNPINILFGFGLGSVSNYLPFQNVHNYYFDIMLQFGVIGLLLFGIFTYKMIKHVATIKQNTNSNYCNYFLIACGTILISFMFSDLAGGYFRLTFLFLGLAFAYLDRLPSSNDNSAENSK